MKVMLQQFTKKLKVNFCCIMPDMYSITTPEKLTDKKISANSCASNSSNYV